MELSERQVTALAMAMVVAIVLVVLGSMRLGVWMGETGSAAMIQGQRRVIDSLAVRAARADTLEAQLGVLICVSPGAPPQIHRC